MNKFEKMFNPNGLLVPDRIPLGSALRVPKRFEAPPELILDGYCTPVEDQGSKPWCAAYSATNFAESVLWRVNGYRTDIDPGPVYWHAKSIDGDPTGDGTYLECALKGLVAGGIFKRECLVRTFGNSWYGFGDSGGADETKYAVHRYGCCLAGFNITDEWFDPKDAVVRGGPGFVTQGGHAVLVCGYDEGGFLVMNSWGKAYGREGKVYVSNRAFERQFMYGAVLTRVLDGAE